MLTDAHEIKINSVIEVASVGYPFGTKGWRLFDIDRNEFFVSRDVTFIEDTFPGIDNTPYVSPPVLQTNEPVDDWLVKMSESRGSIAPLVTTPQTPPLPPVTIPTTSSSIPTSPPASTVLPSPVIPSTTNTTIPTESPTSDNQTSVALPTTDTNVSSSPAPAPSPSSPPSPPVSTNVPRTMQHESQSPGLLEVLGRGHRAKKPSILLKEFVTNTAQTTTPPLSRSFTLWS